MYGGDLIPKQRIGDFEFRFPLHTQSPAAEGVLHPGPQL